MSDLIHVSDEVARALRAKRPIVALESTVITHGLPHPQGLTLARELERVVMATGAVPATIGVIDGALQVGLSADQLERLGGTSGAEKLNLGNLAAQIAAGGRGSTTVSSTMFAAARVGITVFATGGIGGVHRGASESGDVSSDLGALARFPVAVVCAGAKAILDLPKTVERLETLGVPIYGFGTDEFPAFYRQSSGLPVDRAFDSIADLANAVRTHFELGLGTGVVVANPIPSESELPAELFDSALAKALAELETSHVRGRAATPFLLERLSELTEGRTITANLALLEHNARVAAELARELAQDAGE
jgi:pseudouridylate synthase